MFEDILSWGSVKWTKVIEIQNAWSIVYVIDFYEAMVSWVLVSPEAKIMSEDSNKTVVNSTD